MERSLQKLVWQWAGNRCEYCQVPQERLTHYELGQSLGLDRFETDALLKCHEVTEHSLAHEDVDADVKSLNELRTVSS